MSKTHWTSTKTASTNEEWIFHHNLKHWQLVQPLMKDLIFHHTKQIFSRIQNSLKNWQVLEGHSWLQRRNVLVQSSYKLYGLRGRISLKTCNKTIFQRNKIKIMKWFWTFLGQKRMIVSASAHFYNYWSYSTLFCCCCRCGIVVLDNCAT